MTNPKYSRAPFGALPGLAPIDGTARRVVARAEKPTQPLAEGESEMPLPLWPWRGPSEHDMTGKRRGLLTVIGAAARPRPTPGTRAAKKGSSAGRIEA